MPIKADKLAMLIERSIPPIESPRLDLEQYTTPGDLAARIAVHARLSGILDGAIVADLGAGTCRLLIPLLILGASKGYAIEADPRLASGCIVASKRLGVEDRLVYIESRIEGGRGPLLGGIDIVVSNPPFGVWRRGADWEILGYALSLGPERVYAILKAGNIKYHSRRASELGYRVRVLWEEDFPLPASMERHRSRVRWVKVDVVLFEEE